MLKNISFLIFSALVLQACGGKDVEFEADPDLNFEANLDLICENQSFNYHNFKVKSIHYGAQLAQVEVQLATLKDGYSTDDACIPFSVVVTNKGEAPLHLTDEQLVQLNDNSVGFYGQGSRLFKETLVPVADDPILHGEPWLPGAQLEFAAFMTLDRIKLYTPSYLTGAVEVWNASFQGPSPLLGVTAVNALVTVHSDQMPGGEVELVVRFNDGVDLTQAEAIIAASGSAIKSTISFDFLPTMLVIIPPNKSIDEMIHYFEQDPLVKYATRNDDVTLKPF